MKYLVAGPAIVNDIVFKDNKKKNQILGGSIYCVAGIKLWCDSCLFISNVGDDYDSYYGDWMNNNQCCSKGLRYVLPRTWYTTLIYGEDGLHREVSIYNDEVDSIQTLNDVITAEQIADNCAEDTKGIYVEASERAPLWNDIDIIKEKSTAKIMWELPTSAALEFQRKDAVLSTFQKVDIISINLPEAQSLFGVNNEQDAIDAIMQTNKPCFFRVGKKGSYMIEGNKARFAPSVTVGKIVDPTGCGNVSTAAALYAWCEGMSGEKIAQLANISAAYNLLQFGPYPQVSKETRRQANNLLKQR